MYWDNPTERTAVKQDLRRVRDEWSWPRWFFQVTATFVAVLLALLIWSQIEAWRLEAAMKDMRLPPPLTPAPLPSLDGRSR